MFGKKNKNLIHFPTKNNILSSSSKESVIFSEFMFPNKDLLYFSDKKVSEIPIPTGLNLGISISIMNGEIKWDSIESDDPSTIFIKLPIEKYNLNEHVEPLGYYPSYAALNPRQRWKYLSWLQDITKPIDIGYVFIYYYGLERQLLIGKFDIAFDEILRLLKCHDNSSFNFYSKSALINAALIKSRFDRIQWLENQKIDYEFNNVFFMIAYKMKSNLSVENLMLIFRRMAYLNKRYFKENKGRFKDLLLQVLMEKFNKPFFPFPNNYDLEKIPKSNWALFANISIPDYIKYPEFPDFYRYEPLMNDLKNIFMLTHMKFKEFNKNSKKQKI